MFSTLKLVTCSVLVAVSCNLSAADSTTITLQPVPFTSVHLQGGFWGPRQETNRTVSIPHSIDMLKKAGNLYDLQLAAEGKHTGYKGPLFIDSDLYKAVEAIASSLSSHPDPALEKQLDEIIEQIAAAQQTDGYLNSYKQVVEPDKRWANLRDQHELYCAGHLFEAAVAHYQATGKRTLLNVAIRYADYIDSVFGDAPGKRMGYPGHEEIELALFKLWKVTGQQRYYNLARFFLESRGRHFFATEHNTPLEKYDGKHWQDNVPLRDHKKIVGHAVRAGYLLSAATDYAINTGDKDLIDMLQRVWRNTTGANMYITGGIGSSAKNEGFTEDFDLPNLDAYQETCASVAMIMWNHRLGLMTGDAHYADITERALYNGFLSGVSLDGTRFFYVNPLASTGHHHRTEWYSCACCPPNVTRTLAQLGGYAYATSPGALWVNLYMQGTVTTTVDEKPFSMKVRTDYPWSGDIHFDLETTSPVHAQLRFRKPAWCTNATLNINGTESVTQKTERGYLVLDGTWKSGDKIDLHLDMPVTRVAADPRVKEDVGLLAIQRGPVVYCLEGVDQQFPVHEIGLPAQAELKPQFRPELLGGVTVLNGEGQVATTNTLSVRSGLYAPLEGHTSVSIQAIPYYAWDNRAPGEMAVWLPTTPPAKAFITVEGLAQVTMSYVSKICTPGACRDGIEPAKSSDHPVANCHWWPHKGTPEWVQYTWDQPQTISASRVFWFDDTGSGECRLPADWHLEYLDDTHWKKVTSAGPPPVRLDTWCETEFQPVKTTALRLVLNMKKGYAAGVHEWQVTAD